MSAARPPWRAISLMSLAAVLAAAAIGGSSPVRSALVVWVLVSCPGLALARNIDIGGLVEELSLGLAISIAFNVAVALGLVYLGLWSAWAVFAIGALATVTAVVAGRRTDRRAPA